MGLLTWIRNVVGGKVTAEQVKASEMFQSAAIEVCVRELALQSAINLLAGAVSKCEFRVMKSGKVAKDDEYYRWNVRPNQNQSGAAFKQKLISQLCRNNEALVVEVGDSIYVADDFSKEEFALLDYKFTGVKIDNLVLDRVFWMPEVMYFRLHNKDINKVLGQLYGSYGKLLACGMKAYQRSRGVRGKLKINSRARSDPKFEETYQKLTGTDLKTFMSKDYAILPEYEGMEYEELGSKTYSPENSRDVKAMVDDIFEFTAKAFGIPAAVLKGEVADTSNAVDNLLTFAVDPLAAIIQDEINAKLFTKQEFLEGCCVRICTTFIRHIDLFSIAEKAEKVISSGLFSVNELLAILGEPKINEPWADRHFITKNYEEIEKYLGGKEV